MTLYRIPHRVAHVVPEEEPDAPCAVFLMQLPDGTPVVLRDSAAWIWLLAVDGEGDVASAVADLVQGGDRPRLAADVARFLDELVERGLLEVGPTERSPIS